MRTVLIILHAAPDVIGLIAGLVALVAYDWTDLDTAARIAFTGLVGLAGIMGYRLWRAHRETVVRRNGWQVRYLAPT